MSLKAALLCLVLSLLASIPCIAAEAPIVYTFEQNNPIPDTEHLPEPILAVLAMYSLQNSTGCGLKISDTERECRLTSALGLGGNCSPEHLAFVHAWFKRSPELTSRWSETQNADTSKPGALESLCFNGSDSGSWVNIWQSITIKSNDKSITVDATLVWGSNNGVGRDRYEHTYEVNNHEIVEKSGRMTEVSRSGESMFGLEE